MPTAYLGYIVWPFAPRLQTCIACYCTKQQRLNQMRENENQAIKRHS